MTTNNIIINDKKHTIELSKKFAAAAKKFGSEQYKQLQEARKDHPNYSVVTITRKTTAKKVFFKGLTYDYMEAYIQKHDDEAHSIMEEYRTLRGLSDEAKENLGEVHSYFQMKQWFLNKFPAIQAFHENCNKMLAT